MCACCCGFLLAGELQEYVVGELNVVELETCDDVLRYAELVAEPEWQLLGKKLGKDMGKVGMNYHWLLLCVVVNVSVCFGDDIKMLPVGEVAFACSQHIYG